jgi:hypothetical protein
MRQLIIAGLSLATACFSSPASARVERIEILSRQAFAAGTEFSHAGAYEKLRGRAFFALDPDAAANGPIADLKLAPRNNRGLVEFSAEFLVLRPADVTRRNGTLLYEVNNRGNIAIFRQLHEAPSNNDPATAADAGNGFLLRHGFSLVWSAWACRCRRDARRQSAGAASADRYQGRHADHGEGRLRADHGRTASHCAIHRHARHRISRCERGGA